MIIFLTGYLLCTWYGLRIRRDAVRLLRAICRRRRWSDYFVVEERRARGFAPLMLPLVGAFALLLELLALLALSAPMRRYMVAGWAEAMLEALLPEDRETLRDDIHAWLDYYTRDE